MAYLRSDANLTECEIFNNIICIRSIVFQHAHNNVVVFTSRYFVPQNVSVISCSVDF